MSVYGSVQFRGEPLPKGTIEFVSRDATQQTGGLISQGEYSIPASKGLLPGEFIVRISAVEETGAASTEAPGPESARDTARELIPPEYNVNSKLTADVTADGPNKFDFKFDFDLK